MPSNHKRRSIHHVPGWALRGTTLYGTTRTGGANGYGEEFSTSRDVIFFAILHSFNGMDGAYPVTTLRFGTGGEIYGDTNGYNGNSMLRKASTLFRLMADGTFTLLHSFAPEAGGGGGIVVHGSTIFGATNAPIDQGGSVYQYSVSTGGFRVLYDFASDPDQAVGPRLSGLSRQGYLIGTTAGGLQAASGYGSLFQVTRGPGGARYSTIHQFAGKRDGAEPLAGPLVLPSGDLVGTTDFGGGAKNFGIIYSYAGAAYQNLATLETHQVPEGKLQATPTLVGNAYVVTASDGGLPCRATGGSEIPACGGVLKLVP